MLELWFATFIAEVLLYGVPVLWRMRTWVAPVLLLCIATTSALLATHVDWPAAVLLGMMTIFRCGNLMRIIKARMHEAYMKRAVTRTSFMLFCMHAGLVLLSLPFIFDFQHAFVAFMFIQLVVAAGILVTAIYNTRKLRFQMPTDFLPDRDLPTVTVAIPARNETIDLEACLQSVITSDYPKMEIIVLDDCSQKQTGEIIRGFAHEGVRFVQGGPPTERWLAKNQAYQKLYEEASGELVLFCGVDARFGVHAIRGMVNLLYARNKSMLSVLPLRDRSTPVAAFIQPLRYWWELALPRRLFNRPPVLSTCWMIGRSDLKKLGGFKAVSRSIMPEAYFARELVKTDRYSFIRSSNELDVTSNKTLSDQYETAIRMRYPQIRQRPEWALLLTLANTAFLLTPFGLLLASFWWHTASVGVLGLICMLLIASHVLIVSITDPANILLACLNFPLVAVAELITSYASMIQYEFFTVTWKDRNISFPVMHVIPRLPHIDKTDTVNDDLELFSPKDLSI